jgi:hypothetical protein
MVQSDESGNGDGDFEDWMLVFCTSIDCAGFIGGMPISSLTVI